MKISKGLVFIFALGMLVFSAGMTSALKFVGTPGSSVLKIKTPNIATSAFFVSQTPVVTVINSASNVDTVSQDMNVSAHINGTTLTGAQININVSDPSFSTSAVTISSSDPSIATVNSAGEVTRVSNGTARILVSAPFLKQSLNVPVSYVLNEPTITSYNNYATGTLGKDVSNAIDNRIASVTSGNASTYKPIFSTKDHADSTYVRNTSSWIYGIDLTPISPWNSDGGVYKAGTLISPKHIVFANHYPIANGSKIRFVTQDNVVVERTLVNSVNADSDIRVGVLDSDVPGTITFAKFLPDGWQNYIPGLSHIVVPCFYTDQDKSALVDVLPSAQVGSSSIYFNSPSANDSHRKALYKDLIGGDSGSPVFLIINNQLVILTTWWFGGSGAGANFTTYKSDINAAMTTLGGGYQLTTVNLSGFSSY